MNKRTEDEYDLAHARKVQMRFGKHAGMSLGWIADNDPQYMRWLSGAKLQLPCLRNAVPIVVAALVAKNAEAV